jgi:hypothetical protein
MKSLHLFPEDPRTSGAALRRACRMERHDADLAVSAEDLWFEFPEGTRGLSPGNAGPFALAAYKLAMNEGRDFVIHAPVERSLLVNLAELVDAWSMLVPTYFRRIEIAADAAVDDVASRPASEEAVLALSGGVDSLFTLWRHTRRPDGIARRRLGGCVLALGFDISRTDEEACRRAVESAGRLTDAASVPLIPVRTNFREAVPVNWELCFSEAAVACLRQFQGRFGYGLLASGEPYDKAFLPWGSSPALDHLLSSRAFDVVHDGAAFTRLQKLEALASWPEACANLRVCWQPGGRGANCGVCEKCIRTMYGFVALGLPVPPCFPAPPSEDKLRRVRFHSAVVLSQWGELLEVARQRLGDADWIRVAEKKLRADARVLRPAWESPVREEPRTVIGRALRRLRS